jgi:chitodextrinase
MQMNTFQRFRPSFLCLLLALLSGSNASSAAISYVQNAWTNPSSPVSTATATFAGAETAGDLNLVFVGWSDSTSTVSSITDSKGNVYTLAVGPTRSSGNASQSIYYAKNIVAAAANANTVTVTFSTAVAYPDVRIVEYSGVSTTTPLDVVSGAAGSGTALDSGAMTTTVANDLLVLGNYIEHSTTSEGGGFTERLYDTDSQVVADAIEGTTGTYHATATQDPSGWWILSAVALQPANTGGDTQPPTTPSGLSATAASNTQINLSWTASTDNVGVTGYRIERCQGPSCTSFSQIATTGTSSTYSDSSVPAGASFTYRVRASDAAGNVSGYSNTATAATGAILYVQSTSSDPLGPVTIVSATFVNAQAAGDLNIIVVSANDSTSGITSLTDSKSNTYTLAAGPTRSTGNATQWVYFAKNIAAAMAGSNTITVTFNAAVNYPDLRLVEYSGLDTAAPLDGAAGAAGASTSTDSGAFTTTNANDLLFASNYVAHSTTGPGAGFTERLITGDQSIVEDEIVGTTGSYHGTAPQDTSGWWVMQLVAFKAASGGGGDTTPPTAPSGLTATAISSTQINLSWTASTDNVGVTGYKVERCQGASCTTFAQIATPTTTTYSDTGLTASTSYSYRVRATDAAGNLSGYSNVASATTTSSGDTTPPTAPSGLGATVTSSSQINLSWTASTDNVGVTGYKVERCQGASCTTFAQIAAPTTTTYSDTGLTASTSYSYRVRATDAAGNLSGYSNTASATTNSAGDTTPPTAPSNLQTSGVGASVVTLTWTESTDNVGVTGYKVERCQGANCTTFAQIGTPTANSYTDSGLTAATSYSYRVRATDAAGNLSTYSNTASATTASALTAPSGLGAPAVSSIEVDLSWVGSTGGAGTISYQVEGCTPANCSSFSLLGTSTTPTFNVMSLTGNTPYSFRVRATDTSGDLSAYSSTFTLTTPLSGPDCN